MSTVNGYEETLAADGSTAVTREFIGPVRVSLSGDFGGGTATVQFLSPVSEDWIDEPDGAFTAEASELFDYPQGIENRIRVTLSGATAPDLLVILQGRNVAIRD